MDLEKFNEEFGRFWPFNVAFILQWVICFFIVVYYIIFQNKYSFLKAKGPYNLALIFFAGQCQSWGHYLYSMPVYTGGGDSVISCLIVGYIVQHLLGTTMLFYALLSRLIKFGMVFKAFDFCFRRETILLWTKLKYKARLIRDYKLAVLLSVMAIVVPIVIFIFCIHQFKTLTITDEMYCSTDPNWKIAFVVINTFYFLVLGTLVCFVPRKIEGDYFNEAGALVHSILYAIAIFILEIWIGFGDDDTYSTWKMISNAMMFSIHLFVILRIFGYRFHKALTGDTTYSDAFKRSLRLKNNKQIYFQKIMLSPKSTDPLLDNFLTYLQVNLAASELTLNSLIGIDSKAVNVSKIVDFIKSTLKFEERMLDTITDEVKTSENYEGMMTSLFRDFCAIREKFISHNILPLSPIEVETMERMTKDQMNPRVFSGYNRNYLSVLYSNYFNMYITTEEAGRLSSDIRTNLETDVGIDELMGGLYRDDSDYERGQAVALLERAKLRSANTM